MFHLDEELVEKHFSDKGDDPEGTSDSDWVPVEMEVATRIWKPDAEILRLKGFK